MIKKFAFALMLLLSVRAEAFELTKAASSYDLSPRYVADPAHNLSARDVFAAKGEATPPRGTYWMVFNIENNSAKKDWMLDLGLRTNGTVGAVQRTAFFAGDSGALMTDGRLVENKVQMMGQDRNALPLKIEPGRSSSYALYIEPATPLSFKPRLVAAEEYRISRGVADFVDKTVGAAALLACAFFAFFFARHRDGVTPLLIVYTAAQYFVFCGNSEIIPAGNSAALEHLGLAAGVAASAAFLMTYEMEGRKSRVLEGMTVLGLVLGALSYFYLPPVLILYALLPFLMVGFGLAAFLRDDAPQTVPRLLSWALLMAGGLTALAGILGFAPFSPLVNGAYWFAFAPHLAMLSGATLRFISAVERHHSDHASDEIKRREDEVRFLKSKELNDQAQLLRIAQNEKQLVESLRAKETEILQAMAKAKESAEKANRAKSDFLAIVAHEIRTPMNGIMGIARLLLDTPLSGRQKEYAHTIRYAGDALMGLLNDILDLSKADAGKMQVEKIDFDLSRLIESLMLLMSGRAEEKKIGLKTDIGPGTPVLVKGDPTRIQQVLLNLLGNAIKFTEKGSVTLEVTKVSGDSKNAEVQFAVRDTGMGISADAQKRIFTPYAQGGVEIARQFGGTGLGLSICQRLVTAMGGILKVESKVGAGATFHFTLPLGVVPPSALEPKKENMVASPLKILVVDDNQINQRVATGLLEVDGHDIVTVDGAQEALIALRRREFDVVLMDVEMPEVDGLEASRMIRAMEDKSRAGIPIVAMSAHAASEEMSRCIDAGMNDYFTKPIDRENLRRMLLKVAQHEAPFERRAPVATPGSAVQDPTIDGSVLHRLKHNMSRPDFDAMMEKLYKKATEYMESLEKAAGESNLRAISVYSHSMRGMAANYGLSALGAVALEVTKAARDASNVEEVMPAIRKLRPATDEACKAAEAWVKAQG